MLQQRPIMGVRSGLEAVVEVLGKGLLRPKTYPETGGLEASSMVPYAVPLRKLCFTHRSSGM